MTILPGLHQRRDGIIPDGGARWEALEKFAIKTQRDRERTMCRLRGIYPINRESSNQHVEKPPEMCALPKREWSKGRVILPCGGQTVKVALASEKSNGKNTTTYNNAYPTLPLVTLVPTSDHARTLPKMSLRSFWATWRGCLRCSPRSLRDTSGNNGYPTCRYEKFHFHLVTSDHPRHVM